MANTVSSTMDSAVAAGGGGLTPGDRRRQQPTKVDGGGGEREKWVFDSSVDHRGRVPLRSSTGAWKAALFIIAMEFSERLSYFSISMNLVVYLTEVLHEDLKTAARSVNYWQGLTTLMPLAGGFVADAYLGRFATVLVSSLVYLVGLSLLAMSQFVPILKPCKEESGCGGHGSLHRVAFFASIYIISFATGGHKPSLESFGADQFDDDHAGERRKKMSYFNWWNFSLSSGVLLGVTVVSYLQANVGWGAGDVVIAAVIGVSVIVFLSGMPFYRYRVPPGSPLAPMLRVLAAAFAKRKLALPCDARELYEVSEAEKPQKRLLHHTNKLRWIDKAAIVVDSGGETEKQRRLATVTEVEELKLVLSLVPIWLASLPFGLTIAQAPTFFIKQSSTMDRRLFGSFEAPSSSVIALGAIAMIITLCLYDRALVPCLRQLTGNDRGITILQRIGTGTFFNAVTMTVAAVVERKRLKSRTSASTMSIAWLVPQLAILGLGDGFTVVGLQEYFYDQVPDGMRSLGIAFYLSIFGAGNFLSGFLVTAVDHLTSRGGGSSWFAKDLNRSRLDKFYLLLAATNAVDLCIFVYIAKRYSYKSVRRVEEEEVLSCRDP